MFLHYNMYNKRRYTIFISAFLQEQWKILSVKTLVIFLTLLIGNKIHWSGTKASYDILHCNPFVILFPINNSFRRNKCRILTFKSSKLVSYFYSLLEIYCQYPMHVRYPTCALSGTREVVGNQCTQQTQLSIRQLSVLCYYLSFKRCNKFKAKIFTNM